jgi:hypothetical protein
VAKVSVNFYTPITALIDMPYNDLVAYAKLVDEMIDNGKKTNNL